MEQGIASVLFTDLVRSTEVFGRLGPAEAESVRRAHFEDLREAISKHAGELVKTLGDGVMAVFPLASSALDCASAAQGRFSDPDAARKLAGLRIGVSVGELTSANHDYHGVAVNEAARLCHAAKPGQILCARAVHHVIGTGTSHRFGPVQLLSLRGLSDAFEAEELLWTRPPGAPPRVVLADDAVVLRQGIARLLDDEGFHVVGQAGDALELLALVADVLPDVVVTDIRMPPNMALDGLEAALEIRARFPEIGILVLSQHVEARYATQLLGERATAVGYLLKERITAIEDFAAAVRRIAEGGTAVDPEIVEELMNATRSTPHRLAALSEREREVLSLMAEGMSNVGIAERLVISQRTVESHVAAIFSKLDMPPEPQDDRRVLAVMRYLEDRP